MSNIVTTQDILDYDPQSRYLYINPDNPDFGIKIQLAEDRVKLILKNIYPGLQLTDMADTSELKIPIILAVLVMLYRGAIMAKGSFAQELANSYQRDFDQIMKTKFSLKNGEKVKPLSGTLLRG
jgi:hypothetical protein